MTREQTEQTYCPSRLRSCGDGFRACVACIIVLLWAASSQAAEPVFRPVDFGASYNTPITDLRAEAPGFPEGTQIFGGIPFGIGGKVEVTGLDAASHGEFLLPQVTGIPVNQKLTRLHLLHGASHGQRDGTPLANLVIHYKSGESRTVRLAFGVHTRNWIEENGAKGPELGDPNSHIVWTNDSRDKKSARIRLYHTPLDNPLPNDEVSSLDFVSLFSRATPVLFGVTVQNGGDTVPLQPLPARRITQRASQFDDSVYRRTLTVRVTDSAGGAPLTNAAGMLTIKDDSRSFFFGQYRADSSGRIIVSYPPQQAVSITLRVNSPGFVPGVASLSAQRAEPWPEAIDLSLKRGKPIGGIVKGSDGKPVSDANVIPFEVKQTGPKEYTRYDLDAVKTDANGKWLTAAVSESLSNVSFEVVHPDYHSLVAAQIPTPDLLSSKALMVLEPHVRIYGRVVDDKGAPIPNATVTLDRGNDSPSRRPADRNGQFAFTVPDATNSSANVIATAPNFAPTMQAVALELGTKPVDIALNSGSPFKVKMVDQTDQPVAGVKVTLVSWQGSRALEWRTETDSEGRFVWDHAPAGSVTFRFEKTGHSVHTHSTSLPNNGEYQFTYSRMLTVAGKVIDAETKKPIDRFTVVKRYQYENNTPKRWNRYSTTTGRKGAFSSTLGGISRAQWSLVIEAKGYEPFVSESFTGSYSNIFALKKGVAFTGKVFTPDGQPVAKAEVVLLDNSANASMDQGGKFRKSSSYYEVVTTDANGSFELTPKAEAEFVLAAHPKIGFAQLGASEVQQSGKVVLQPWGHVKGFLRIEDKIEPHHSISLHTDVQQSLPSGRNSVPLYLYYQAKPNADGSFAFDAVPPGARMVYLRYQFPGRTSGTMPLSHNIPVTVKPGETNDVVIGGSGRTVTGKVKVQYSSLSVPIDWRRDVHTLRFQGLPAAGIPPPISFPPNATPEERQRLLAEQNAARQAFFRERARLAQSMQRTYVLVFDDDGSFHIPSVPPGNYSLNIAPTDPRQQNSYRQIGNLNSQVTVPDGKGPHDLGTFNLSVNL